MKKAWIPFAALFLLAACEEEIDLQIGNDAPVLLMNAQLRTDDTLHAVVLNRSLLSRLELLDGANVTVTVNGTERIAATPREKNGYYNGSLYCFRADFKAGDHVRIDAVHGEEHAFAEVDFPEPATIVSVDTVRTEMPGYYGYWSYQFRTRIRDIAGIDNYYRVTMERLAAYELETGDAGERMHWEDQERTGFDASSDPIISDGIMASSGSDDLFGDLMPGNAYCAFTDRLFRDGDCTLRVEAPLGSFVSYYTPFSYPVRERHFYAVVKLYTMSLYQYRYLRAIDNFEAFGYEMSFLVEPTSLPSNVKGGIGFVSAETCAEARILMPASLIPDEPRYYRPVTGEE